MLLDEVRALSAKIRERLGQVSVPADDVSKAIGVQAELDDLEDALSDIKKEVTKSVDKYRLVVVPSLMEEQGMSSVSIAGIGRATLVSDAHVSVLVANQEDFYQWLRDNGSGDIIKETVHAGTLKAFVKGMIKDGREIPEVVKVTPFTRAQITRS